MEVHDVLHNIQKSLVVPKSQFNSFAKFYYRTCEDILEAVKKLLPEGANVQLDDRIVKLGERYYVKSTVYLTYNNKMVSASAYAREPLAKKGMDESQITGATSSYARKYALNALFLIDDTRDADTKDNSEAMSPLLQQFIKTVNDRAISLDIQNKWKEHFKIKEFSELDNDTLHKLIAKMKEAE